MIIKKTDQKVKQVLNDATKLYESPKRNINMKKQKQMIQ